MLEDGNWFERVKRLERQVADLQADKMEGPVIWLPEYGELVEVSYTKDFPKFPNIRRSAKSITEDCLDVIKPDGETDTSSWRYWRPLPKAKLGWTIIRSSANKEYWVRMGGCERQIDTLLAELLVGHGLDFGEEKDV